MEGILCPDAVPCQCVVATMAVCCVTANHREPLLGMRGRYVPQEGRHWASTWDTLIRRPSPAGLGVDVRPPAEIKLDARKQEEMLEPGYVPHGGHTRFTRIVMHRSCFYLDLASHIVPPLPLHRHHERPPPTFTQTHTHKPTSYQNSQITPNGKVNRRE
ncbi:hypothetical protein VUR80DRAFT_10179 [Thermomyces stellatus]